MYERLRKLYGENNANKYIKLLENIAKIGKNINNLNKKYNGNKVRETELKLVKLEEKNKVTESEARNIYNRGQYLLSKLPLKNKKTLRKDLTKLLQTRNSSLASNIKRQIEKRNIKDNNKILFYKEYKKKK